MFKFAVTYVFTVLFTHTEKLSNDHIHSLTTCDCAWHVPVSELCRYHCVCVFCIHGESQFVIRRISHWLIVVPGQSMPAANNGLYKLFLCASFFHCCPIFVKNTYQLVIKRIWTLYFIEYTQCYLVALNGFQEVEV